MHIAPLTQRFSSHSAQRSQQFNAPTPQFGWIFSLFPGGEGLYDGETPWDARKKRIGADLFLWAFTFVLSTFVCKRDVPVPIDKTNVTNEQTVGKG